MSGMLVHGLGLALGTINVGLDLGTQGLGLRNYGLDLGLVINALALSLRPRPRQSDCYWFIMFREKFDSNCHM